jgi:hypothetical protein
MLKQLLNEVLRLDILDLNYGISAEPMQWIANQAAPHKRRGLAIRCIAFGVACLRLLGQGIGQLPRHLAALWRIKRPPPGMIMVFATSQNQYASMAPLLERMPHAYLVTGGIFSVLHEPRYRVPSLAAYLLALPWFGLTVRQFQQSRGYQRDTFFYAFDLYWLTYGYYVLVRLWLAWLRPAALIVANDHTMAPRTMTYAARQQHIPTFYIQHASVSRHFPPLAFSYALLEGLDTLHKYCEAGPSQTRVFLVGMPRADRYVQHINTSSTVASLGVCLNLLDPVAEVQAVCRYLYEVIPGLAVTLRPHPRDFRGQRAYRELAARYGWHYSDPHTESSFHLLQRVDAIIAGESNILLEAALLNVVPVMYHFTGQYMDWYGFHRHGVVTYCATREHLRATLYALMQQKPAVRANTAYYCATVGTPFDGRSSDLANTLIQHVLARGVFPAGQWEPVAGVSFEAFEPVESSLHRT